MPMYETTINIQAPCDRVWAVLADVEHWSEWTPTISQIQALESKPLAPGSRYLVIQPKLRPAEWTVTAVEPAKGFSWEMRGPGIRAIADHWIQSHDGTSCAVTLRVTFAGLLAPVIGALSRRITERYLFLEASSLKKKLEQGA